MFPLEANGTNVWAVVWGKLTFKGYLLYYWVLNARFFKDCDLTITLYEGIAYNLPKLFGFFFHASFGWVCWYVNWTLGIIDLERFFKLEELPMIFEKLRELLLVVNLFYCYGFLKWRLCMLNDEVSALGIIFVDPINDFSSWFGKYEKEIGFRSEFNDYVFFKPLFELNWN